MSTGPGRARRFILKTLNRWPQMAVRDLAKRYAMEHPPPEITNHLYVIRRACKQLEERGEIDLWLSKDGKLTAKKHTEPPPWQGDEAKLAAIFHKRNETARRKREKLERERRERLEASAEGN